MYYSPTLTHHRRSASSDRPTVPNASSSANVVREQLEFERGGKRFGVEQSDSRMFLVEERHAYSVPIRCALLPPKTGYSLERQGFVLAEELQFVPWLLCSFARRRELKRNEKGFEEMNLLPYQRESISLKVNGFENLAVA